ncbi:hypothetical protein [Methyloversatilis sp. NSM2]|uniref:hypothetical protein n=1 Tax=Methyloversatilis sp. NSM2 TaxID=3134135 RepID=UPI003112ADFC
MPYAANGQCFATLAEAVAVECVRTGGACYQAGSRLVGHVASTGKAYVLTGDALTVLPVAQCATVTASFPATVAGNQVSSPVPQWGADAGVLATCSIQQIQIQGVPNIPPNWAEVSAFCSLGFGFTFAAYLFAQPFGELIRLVRKAKGS